MRPRQGAPRPASAPAAGTSARAVALDAIRRVIDDGGYSNLVVPAALGRSRLDGRDRAFAADLTYGTIRHLRSLDWAIEQRANRPVARMSPGARHVLRLGAYQLLFAHVAPHAAVGETVGLAGPKERSFVNAVLRKLSSDPPAWPRGPSRLPPHRVACVQSLPCASARLSSPPPASAPASCPPPSPRRRR